MFKTSIIAAALAITGILANNAHALTFNSKAEIEQWARLHTEAPMQYRPATMAPVTIRLPAAQPSNGFVPGPGPYGAQYGAVPSNNQSFIDPTRNSLNAHQTQNSVQATNAMQSTQAVQGRNCSLMAIKAGLCQGH